MCELAHGPAPADKPLATHSCGNGHLGCVHPGHLRWGDLSDNYEDSVEHGTAAKGQRHGLAKLTESDVLQIMALKGTMSQPEIAARYGVHFTCVGNIHQGRTWSWLTGVAKT